MCILHPIAAFTDNYIWALRVGAQALVVDPGDARPVLDWLAQEASTLTGILITHHHADHTGGVAELLAHTGARAWGPAGENLPQGVERVPGGATLTWQGLALQVIDVPGHTAGHAAFFAPDAAGSPVLFCGDTLFSAGCGRLFEGTPEQMLNSLDRLAALPGQTRVCCSHEYTVSNLRFARAVEPSNPDLPPYTAWCETERAAHRPTLPSTLSREMRINPFLRSREPSVRQALLQRGWVIESDMQAFAALRRWKDDFR
jgi:hydroxyacylglutathione hydrolase